MVEQNFTESMAGFRDEDLIRISYSDEDEGYEPSAIIAARQELARRGISSTIVSSVLDEVHDEKEIESSNHLDPLETPARIAFGIFAPLTLTMFGAIILRSRGYHQKSRDAWMSIFCGFLFYAVGVPLVLLILDAFGIA